MGTDVLVTPEWQIINKRVEAIKDSNNAAVSNHAGIYAVLQL